MTLKNKITALFTTITTFLACLPAKVMAIDSNTLISNVLGGQTSGSMSTTTGTVNDTLLTILSFVRGAGVVVCVIMLVWCAIQLASSAGNNQKRQAAMEGIKNVLIAVAIIGSAALIASLAYGILAS